MPSDLEKEACVAASHAAPSGLTESAATHKESIFHCPPDLVPPLSDLSARVSLLMRSATRGQSSSRDAVPPQRECPSVLTTALMPMRENLCTRVLNDEESYNDNNNNDNFNSTHGSRNDITLHDKNNSGTPISVMQWTHKREQSADWQRALQEYSVLTDEDEKDHAPQQHEQYEQIQAQRDRAVKVLHEQIASHRTLTHRYAAVVDKLTNMELDRRLLEHQLVEERTRAQRAVMECKTQSEAWQAMVQSTRQSAIAEVVTALDMFIAAETANVCGAVDATPFKRPLSSPTSSSRGASSATNEDNHSIHANERSDKNSDSNNNDDSGPVGCIHNISNSSSNAIRPLRGDWFVVRSATLRAVADIVTRLAHVESTLAEAQAQMQLYATLESSLQEFVDALMQEHDLLRQAHKHHSSGSTNTHAYACKQMGTMHDISCANSNGEENDSPSIRGGNTDSSKDHRVCSNEAHSRMLLDKHVDSSCLPNPSGTEATTPSVLSATDVVSTAATLTAPLAIMTARVQKAQRLLEAQARHVAAQDESLTRLQERCATLESAAAQQDHHATAIVEQERRKLSESAAHLQATHAAMTAEYELALRRLEQDKSTLLEILQRTRAQLNVVTQHNKELTIAAERQSRQLAGSELAVQTMLAEQSNLQQAQLSAWEQLVESTLNSIREKVFEVAAGHSSGAATTLVSASANPNVPLCDATSTAAETAATNHSSSSSLSHSSEVVAWQQCRRELARTRDELAFVHSERDDLAAFAAEERRRAEASAATTAMAAATVSQLQKRVVELTALLSSQSNSNHDTSDTDANRAHSDKRDSSEDVMRLMRENEQLHTRLTLLTEERVEMSHRLASQAARAQRAELLSRELTTLRTALAELPALRAQAAEAQKAVLASQTATTALRQERDAMAATLEAVIAQSQTAGGVARRAGESLDRVMSDAEMAVRHWENDRRPSRHVRSRPRVGESGVGGKETGRVLRKEAVSTK